jgi:methylated-DNA-[protein]-cysteine S-methyltransferase
LPQLSLHTPVGPITVSAEADAIVSLDWGWGRDQEPTPLLLRAKDWLDAYFDGEIVPMTLALAPSGTAYRLRVWSAIRAIAPGEVRSYQAVARQAGGSPRSVGGAMAANPIPILIPCHRIVGQGPRGATLIGGYSGGEGPETKSFLLDLERRAASRRSAMTATGPEAKDHYVETGRME